jgi:hypothetical protein
MSGGIRTECESSMYRNRLSAPRSVLRMAVDPISNTIAITKANPAYAPSHAASAATTSRVWGKALADGTLSNDLIWPILHELTHHSSLQTLVGHSLAALAVSHTRFVGALSADADQLNGAARDVVRYSILNVLLRPLLEGLALFSEFDAVSGDVPVASWSSHVARRLFCFAELPNAILEGNDLFSPLKKKLEHIRLFPATISRKRALLRSNIFDPGGYLLGYLLIKAIWNGLIMRQEVWKNSDLFVMFLNDYFFDDFELAYAAVCRTPLSIEDEIKNIEIYLYNRVVLLCQNSGTFGRQFAQYSLDPGSGRPKYQNHSTEIEERLNWEWMQRSTRIMHWQTPDFISSRHIPRVLAAPATVSIDTAGNFQARFYDDSPPISGPSLEAGRPASGKAIEADGSVEAVVLLPQHGRQDMRVLLCIFLDKDLVATFDPTTGDFNDTEDAQACDKMGSYLAFESFAEQVESLRSLPEDSAAATVLAAYSGDAAIRRMLDLWGPFALAPDDIQEAERPGALPALENGGLKGALSLDEAVIGKIVRMSLQPIGSEVDTSEIVAASQKTREILGFDLFNVAMGKLEPSRI